MSTFRIALANLPYPSTGADAVSLAEQAIAQVAVEGAALVCFPECFIPGYRAPGHPVPPHDPAFMERAWADVGAAARRARVAVVLGTGRRVGDALRITAMVVDPEGALARWQDKVQLDPFEEATFSPGTERQLFRVGPLTFGVVICHEGGATRRRSGGQHAAGPRWCSTPTSARPSRGRTGRRPSWIPPIRFTRRPSPAGLPRTPASSRR